MPNINVHLPERIADALDRQARSLLLRRRSFIRAILASVAAEGEPARAEEAEHDVAHGPSEPGAQR
jgi:hypothetical protein